MKEPTGDLRKNGHSIHMTSRRPRSLRDIVKLTAPEWVLYNAIIGFYRITGRWTYPFPTNGDYEAMTRTDLAYWMHKAEFPVTRAARSSGLEEFFEKQASFRWAPPVGFTPTSELRISAVGDLMDHPYLPNSSDVLYQDVAEIIFGADISMANLECAISPKASDEFALTLTSAPPLYYRLPNFNAAKGFQGRKYSFMATANNHSLDCGEEGVAFTIQTLKSEGIAFNGTNESEQDACSATILERNGVRVGLISHTFGLNGKKAPRDAPWIVNRTQLNGKSGAIDFGQIEKQLEYCAKHDVDAVVAHLHWGLEHEFYPRPDQLDVAHHLAELGIDVVIGHHPHVVQPVEYYRTRRDPDRVVPIYYSLGNLMTPVSDPMFRRSSVAHVTLAKGTYRDGSTRTYVTMASTHDVFQEFDERSERIRLIGNKTERPERRRDAQVSKSSTLQHLWNR